MDFLNEFTKKEIIEWIRQDIHFHLHPPKKSELLFNRWQTRLKELEKKCDKSREMLSAIDGKGEKMQLIHGDCLEKMKDIPDKSIDMILCDLPYGTTKCKWDVVIPFEPLWEQYKRIIKDRGAIVLFGSQPFTTVMINSNIRLFHHSWVWAKRFAGNFVQSKTHPQKVHEDIAVFGDRVVYYPQKTQRDKPIKKGKNAGGNIYGDFSRLGRDDYVDKIYTDKYPESIMYYSSRSDVRFHPTQKPVSLLEYLIKTYTIEGETVLDNCMGSGSTGIACINTKRNFIGIEKDDKYFEIAKKRIEEHLTTAST